MKRLADTLLELYAATVWLEHQTGLRVTVESSLDEMQNIDHLTVRCWTEGGRLCARVQKSPRRKLL